METTVRFPGGLRIDAQIGDFRVPTDQLIEDGGTETAPSPFDLFLASLATCAGIYVLSFCRQRQLSSEGLTLSMQGDWNEQRHLLERLRITIGLPDDFPEKYRSAVIRAAGMCTVKRQMQSPPQFDITTVKAADTQTERAA
ncbi:MAG: OsmC family protein [Desulfobacterales bacterium]